MLLPDRFLNYAPTVHKLKDIKPKFITVAKY